MRLAHKFAECFPFHIKWRGVKSFDDVLLHFCRRFFFFHIVRTHVSLTVVLRGLIEGLLEGVES